MIEYLDVAEQLEPWWQDRWIRRLSLIGWSSVESSSSGVCLVSRKLCPKKSIESHVIPEANVRS